MLPLWAWKLIGLLVIAAVIFGCGMRLMSQLDAGTIAKQKATIVAEQAAVRQVTAVTAQITKNDQAAEKAAQTTITGQGQVIVKRITTYVPRPGPSVSVPCVSNGMLRVYDAAVLGVDPSTIVPPAASPDAACSTVAAADFMAGVTNNFTIARSNAEQLDSLEADVTARADAAAAAQGPAPTLVTPTD